MLIPSNSNLKLNMVSLGIPRPLKEKSFPVLSQYLKYFNITCNFVYFLLNDIKQKYKNTNKIRWKKYEGENIS